MTIDELISGIRPADLCIYEASRERWNSLAKPLGSLGVLEEDISRIAAAKGTVDVRLEKRKLLIFCADNGVVAQGVSQTDESATTAVASALGRGESTASFMARAARCDITAVNIGMKEETPAGVLDCRIRRSTGDITLGPAMRREECERAILTGASLAEKMIRDGADILLLGEMGIGNTTTSAAAASVLLSAEPEKLAGRGAGLSDAGMRRKIRAIREAVERNRPDPDDPVDIMQKVGGLDLAALCGACLGAARFHIPVLLDGVITNVAALLAVRLCPDVHDVLAASHVSEEPAAAMLLKELQLAPCISAGLHLGEGTGALLALSLLDKALAVYQSGHTFENLGITAYTPQ